jgi:hypothetical protein
MAVLAAGRIQLEGAPQELIALARGNVWARTIARGDLESYRERYEIISTRLFGGETIIHVLSDTDPGNGFAPAAGGLEDVYFSTLARSRRVPLATAA